MLTARQQRILDLLARGYERKEVSRMLGISENTMHNHCSVIYKKLGVTNLLQAINVTRDLSWLG
jgi:DNA-binding NarL/FixJ family response regulator